MLYLLKTADWYKVGFTKDDTTFLGRMSSYATTNPLVELIGTKDGSTADEKKYHSSFTGYPRRGEWYKLPEDVIETLIGQFTPRDIAFWPTKDTPSVQAQQYRELRVDQKKAYRESHKKELSEHGKTYYQENKEKIVAYGKQWRENNPDYQKEYWKKWYQEHRAEKIAYTKEYKRAHK